MKRRDGFTLVELLVVIAIIGILIALLFPAVQSIRKSVRRTECSNQLRQVALAYVNYESTHGKFPQPTEFNHSIFVTLLPFMEQDTLYAQVDFDSFPSDELSNSCPTFLKCPSDSVARTTLNYKSYVKNEPAFVSKVAHSDTPQNKIRKFRDLKVGSTNMALFSEVRIRENGRGHKNQISGAFPNAQFQLNQSVRDFRQWYVDKVAWYHQNSVNGVDDIVHGRVDWCFGSSGYNHLQVPNGVCGFTPACIPPLAPASSYHGNGANLACADGHVEFGSTRVDPLVWWQRGFHENLDKYFDEIMHPQNRGGYPLIGSFTKGSVGIRGDGQTVRVLFKKYIENKWQTVHITGTKYLHATTEPFK